MTAESLATQQLQVRTGKTSLASEHCARLFTAVRGFEAVLGCPPGDPDWRRHLAGALASLRTEFRAHVELTEGPDGLYAGVLADAPRLVRHVHNLGREHRRVLAALDTLADRLDASPHRLRRLSRDVLAELSRHRQRGADLVYEAYATDIGGEN